MVKHGHRGRFGQFYLHSLLLLPPAAKWSVPSVTIRDLTGGAGNCRVGHVTGLSRNGCLKIR